ncbi:MAG: hypothetical protein KDI28_10115 [Pseudomonadales bacterium]|nr:hypothetical protein [Pseudomonadales bacterium]MCP5357722.1 hypothetical protein [Pseudomonadales bacterium]
MRIPGAIVYPCVALALFPASAALAQEPYQLGLGYKLLDEITVGGYLSTEFSRGENLNEVLIEDLAVLTYGNLTDNLSFLLELESVDFYKLDLENDTDSSNTRPAIERLYADYKVSDYASFRVGKQITPIGYWNLQPINVLRETTSNPRLSREMFPKFVTGLSVQGFTPFDETLHYTAYLQNTGDMDAKYINIDVDQHYGLTLEKVLSPQWKMGGSIGKFREKNRNRTQYFQLNTRYDNDRYSFLTEGVVDRHEQWLGGTETSTSVYAQFEYRVVPEHALIARAEAFRDDRVALHEKIGILGYSYRPLFPVSLKLEYQWHADSSNNRLVGSFSILF